MGRALVRLGGGRVLGGLMIYYRGGWSHDIGA